MASTTDSVLSNIQEHGHNLRLDFKTLEPQWLTASPYLEQAHLLDLNTLDQQSQLFALALTRLEPLTEDFAIVKYEESLDLEGLMAELRSLVQRHGVTWKRQEFYVVEFRSKLKPDIDRTRLFKLDVESHREATESGGLLKYWYGVPDAERRNLATCFWRYREDAIQGGKGPWHKQARTCIREMYDEINVKGLRLTIDDNVDSWSIGPYSQDQGLENHARL